jgi:hypothetical protein
MPETFPHSYFPSLQLRIYNNNVPTIINGTVNSNHESIKGNSRKRKALEMDANEDSVTPARCMRRGQERQHKAAVTSFWRFPREIRDLIYA